MSDNTAEAPAGPANQHFIQALQMYGSDWSKIEKHMATVGSSTDGGVASGDGASSGVASSDGGAGAATSATQAATIAHVGIGQGVGDHVRFDGAGGAGGAAATSGVVKVAGASAAHQQRQPQQLYDSVTSNPLQVQVCSPPPLSPPLLPLASPHPAHATALPPLLRARPSKRRCSLTSPGTPPPPRPPP